MSGNIGPAIHSSGETIVGVHGDRPLGGYRLYWADDVGPISETAALSPVTSPHVNQRLRCF